MKKGTGYLLYHENDRAQANRESSPSPFFQYAGNEGADLQGELDMVVTKYFSAGLETLHYGEGT
jgi:hypothetical protein